jgi:protein-S-isoprenylcysteine O-methyltransferase Ste14
VTQLAIKREEVHLEALFGDAWRRYAAKVPRWLKVTPG